MLRVQHLNLCYSRCRIPFACPGCRVTVTSPQFEDHAQTCLKLDPATQCVWCFGAARWTLHSKHNHVTHLLQCWRHFITLHSSGVSPFLPALPFVLNPVQCLDPLGRSSLPPAAYHLFLPLSLDPLPVPFQDKSVNQAAACVRKYLEQTQQGFEFFECTVRGVAFPSFLRALDADQGRTRCLPFSCWCDGGTPQDRSRHHRHLIIASCPPHGRFQREVWRRITPASGIRRKRIESALHLVNTLGNLSQQASPSHGACDSRCGRQPSLFWILTSLPKDYRLPLVLQWDGGILELITQEFRNTDPALLARAPSLCKVNGRWQLAIRDLPGIPLDLVLLVAPHWKPSDTPTEQALHLPRGRRMCFERDASLTALDPQVWGQTQAERGNRFYEVVRDEPWTPSDHQQHCLDAIEPFLREANRLKEAMGEAGIQWEPNRLKEAMGEAGIQWEPNPGREEAAKEEETGERGQTGDL